MPLSSFGNPLHPLAAIGNETGTAERNPAPLTIFSLLCVPSASHLVRAGRSGLGLDTIHHEGLGFLWLRHALAVGQEGRVDRNLVLATITLCIVHESIKEQRPNGVFTFTQDSAGSIALKVPSGGPQNVA